MPAGPIGSVWASGSWSDTAWEANTWANVTPTPPGGQTPAGSRYRSGSRVNFIHSLLLALALWGWATRVDAQTTYVVNVPHSFQITWNDPNPDFTTTGYHLTVNGVTTTVAPASQTPCTACVTATYIALATGSYTATVTALAGDLESAASNSYSWVVTTPDANPTPVPPAIPGSPVIVAVVGSPDGTLVPNAAYVADVEGSIWTRGTNLTACTLPAYNPALCYPLLRNGVQVALGDQILMMDSTLFSHQENALWYRWRNGWIYYGSNHP